MIADVNDQLGTKLAQELGESVAFVKTDITQEDQVQKLVEQETAANAGKAEAEWKETTTRYHAKTLSAVPGINVLPTGSGIEVRVRYITRVYERHEARKRLYEAVVNLMHGRREAVKA